MSRSPGNTGIDRAMTDFQLSSAINGVTGRHTIGYVDHVLASADPAGFAGAVQDYVANAGAMAALVVVPMRVAQVLAQRPGFRIARADWDYTRPGPSGVMATDRTGVRAVTPADTATICRIINASMGVAYGAVVSPEQVARDVFQPGWFNAIVVEDGKDVAYGNAIHAGRTGSIGWIAVVPEAQRRGIGRRLLQLLLAELDTRPHEVLELTVEESNTHAIRLYESFGFRRGDGPFVHVEYAAPGMPPPAF
jgi:GNAT superfamily N-acetyltransferase